MFLSTAFKFTNSGEDKSRGGSAARTGPRVTAESLVTLLCMQNGISIFRAVLFSKVLTTQREQMTIYIFNWYFFDFKAIKLLTRILKLITIVN
jgi:hypothetical protein